MNNIKFSVVIPALNEERFIARAIASLQKQTMPRDQFEIIVVIDKRTIDQTKEIAEKSGADKVFITDAQGTNPVRQYGFEKSQGEIVVFLDSDCVVPPTWLADFEKLFDTKDYVAISGPYDYGFQGFMRWINWIYTHLFMPIIPRLLYILFRKKAGILQEGNFAVRRWALEKIGGLPPLPFYGDGAAAAMLLSRHVGKMLFTPKLTIKSSARRLQKNGAVKQTIAYAAAYLKIYFSKKYQ